MSRVSITGPSYIISPRTSYTCTVRRRDDEKTQVRKVLKENNISSTTFNDAALSAVLRDIKIKAWRSSFFPSEVVASVRTHLPCYPFPFAHSLCTL